MRKSISIKLAFMLVLLISVGVGINWLINEVFMEDYYILHKEEDLVMAYTKMAELLSEQDVISNDDRQDMVAFCEKKSISAFVINSSFSVIFNSGYSVIGDNLMTRTKNLIFNMDNDEGEILKETDNYILQKVYDAVSSSSYLEIYGSFEDGDFFVMRTSVENIKDIINTSNKFYLIVGSGIIILSGITMFFLSMGITKRIKSLANISKEMSMLNFSVKYKDKKSDEISNLGENINDLSGKLENTISDLKNANLQLQKDIEKKIEIDEMRKEFLSNVSHELKTPLAIIQGYSEGLKESVNDDNESREFYCDVIIDEAQKMNRMVQKLLSLNNLESGGNQLEMERFDLIDLIDSVLNKTSVLLQEKDIKVIFNNREKVQVWGDQFDIEEVIVNYVSNAINHCDGEKIIKIELEDKEEKIRCKIFNTGNNIPDKDINNVWIKFFKVDKARTREYGGSGIGLSIVKAIMDNHNQNCGAENLKKGVNFWFELDKASNYS